MQPAERYGLQDQHVQRALHEFDLLAHS